MRLSIDRLTVTSSVTVIINNSAASQTTEPRIPDTGGAIIGFLRPSDYTKSKTRVQPFLDLTTTSAQLCDLNNRLHKLWQIHNLFLHLYLAQTPHDLSSSTY